MVHRHKFHEKHLAFLDSREREKILPRDKILGFINSLCPLRNKIVADIGAGTGYFAIPFLRYVGGTGKVLAVDINEKLLTILKKKVSQNDPIEIILSTEDDIPISELSVDVAFCADLFHELSGKGTLRETKRILKEGMYFIVIDWKPIECPFGPPIDVRVPEGKVISVCGDVGFEFLRHFHAGEYHYGILFKKITH